MSVANDFDAELLSELYASYLDSKHPKTRESYLKNIQPFLTYLKLAKVSDPDRSDIEAYFDAMINHPKDLYIFLHQIDETDLNTEESLALKQFRYKDRTIRSYWNMLNQFFKWLEREDLYPNIMKKADRNLPVPRGHAKDALDVEDVQLLLDYLERQAMDSLDGKRNYAMILLAITTGLRTIEISRAQVEDLTQRGFNTVIYVQGKGRREKDEFVIVPRHTKEVIREYTNARQSEGLMVNHDWTPLFASHGNRNKGGVMSTRSISRIISQSFEAIGIKSNKITPHSLRHTAATLSLLNGSSLRETQKMLRHSSVRTTEIYAQDLNDDLNPSSQLVEDLISPQQEEEK